MPYSLLIAPAELKFKVFCLWSLKQILCYVNFLYVQVNFHCLTKIAWGQIRREEGLFWPTEKRFTVQDWAAPSRSSGRVMCSETIRRWARKQRGKWTGFGLIHQPLWRTIFPVGSPPRDAMITSTLHPESTDI